MGSNPVPFHLIDICFSIFSFFVCLFVSLFFLFCAQMDNNKIWSTTPSTVYAFNISQHVKTLCTLGHFNTFKLSWEPNIYVSWSTSELRGRLIPLKKFKSYINLTVPRWCFFLDPFLLYTFYVCFYYAVLSAPCSLLITCWARTDLLAFLYFVFLWFCHFSMSLIRCDNWLYQFLIFAFILLLI